MLHKIKTFIVVSVVKRKRNTGRPLLVKKNNSNFFFSVHWLFTWGNYACTDSQAFLANSLYSYFSLTVVFFHVTTYGHSLRFSDQYKTKCEDGLHFLFFGLQLFKMFVFLKKGTVYSLYSILFHNIAVFVYTCVYTHTYSLAYMGTLEKGSMLGE